MESSTNEWNSAYWIDHLAKITNPKSIKMSIPEESFQNIKSSPSVTSSLKTGLLIDVSDPNYSPPPSVTKEASLKFSHPNSSPSSTTKEISLKFSDIETYGNEPSSPGQADIRFSKIMDNQPKALVIKETQQIYCSLTDLVLGMESQIIREAYSAIDDEMRRNAYIADNASIVTFASLVEEVKQQKKTTLNVNAFEFKPSSYCQAPSNI
jgi:hypothetical protein